MPSLLQWLKFDDDDDDDDDVGCSSLPVRDIIIWYGPLERKNQIQGDLGTSPYLFFELISLLL